MYVCVHMTYMYRASSDFDGDFLPDFGTKDSPPRVNRGDHTDLRKVAQKMRTLCLHLLSLDFRGNRMTHRFTRGNLRGFIFGQNFESDFTGEK